MIGIQHTLFHDLSPIALSDYPDSYELTRIVRSPHGAPFEALLAKISIQSHDGRFMWATALGSNSGYYKGYACLPCWGNFAASKQEAMNAAINEILPQLHNLSKTEYERVCQWLSELSTVYNRVDCV